MPEHTRIKKPVSGYSQLSRKQQTLLSQKEGIQSANAEKRENRLNKMLIEYVSKQNQKHRL